MADNEYNMEDELDELEEEARQARLENSESARVYITSVLQQADITVTLMGGYSLRLRGSTRSTIDIDLGVNANLMQLKKAVRNDQRIRYPKGPAEAVFRVFVKTGGLYPPIGSTDQVVQVDIKIEGPSTTGVNPTVEMVNIGGQQVRMYDVMTMMALKLKSFENRDSIGDMQDIRWLIRTYEETIKAGQEKLRYERKEYFLNACFEVIDKDSDEGKRFKFVLGVAWPPEE